MKKDKKLSWTNEDGSVLYGIPDLNKSIQEHNKFLKKYYHLGVVFVSFIILVLIWVLWQMKKYKIITFFIDSLTGGCV